MLSLEQVRRLKEPEQVPNTGLTGPPEPAG